MACDDSDTIVILGKQLTTDKQTHADTRTREAEVGPDKIPPVALCESNKECWCDWYLTVGERGVDNCYRCLRVPK